LAAFAPFSLSFALKRSGLYQERRMIAFNLTLMDNIPSLY
jgi:hypothetical protein